MQLHAKRFFCLFIDFFCCLLSLYPPLLCVVIVCGKFITEIEIISYAHACSQRLELMREMYHNEAELSPTSPDYNVESLTGGTLRYFLYTASPNLQPKIYLFQVIHFTIASPGFVLLDVRLFI